jgi:hypothetical protein
VSDIVAQDCRLEGFSSGRVTKIYKAIHLPTGMTVEFSNGLTKREAMERLQRAVHDQDLHDDTGDPVSTPPGSGK